MVLPYSSSLHQSVYPISFYLVGRSACCTHAFVGDGPTPLVTVAIDLHSADLEEEAIAALAVRAIRTVMSRVPDLDRFGRAKCYERV